MHRPPIQLDGKYLLIRTLGEGGFGRVWLAEDVLLEGRWVAIKQLRNDLIHDPALLIDEMLHLSSLDHPHVVQFHHHFLDEDNLYLVMEYCTGGSLADIADARPIEPVKVFEWGKVLANTLAMVHGRGIVHHDIKPQNLLLTADGRLKVADFGVANRNWGTRPYMAPEIELGEADSDDVRIDIYALGVTLLELLLGRNPLSETPGNLLLQTKIQHDFIPTHLDRWVQELLLKATHPTPEARFQSMEDFAEAIQSRHVPYIIAGTTIKAHLLAERAARLLGRKKWVTARKCLNQALGVAPDCVAALVTAGRLELMLRRTAPAKAYFSEAVRISPRIALQKELGWIALEEGNVAHAISMLTDHLRREPADFEACNLLLQCFFQSERYELGEQLAATVTAAGASNECFVNNGLLCRLLGGRFPPDRRDCFDQTRLTSPFIRFNLDVATEQPSCWDPHGPTLKSKALFQDYRFGANGKQDEKPHSLFVEYSSGELHSLESPIITLGRLEANDISFQRNGISRRHAVIVNSRSDIWIYDLGSVTGVTVDGVRVARKAFLDGVHTIGIGTGTCTIRIATNKSLLI